MTHSPRSARRVSHCGWKILGAATLLGTALSCEGQIGELGGGDSATTPGGGPTELGDTVIPVSAAQRLTVEEYRRTLRDLLGVVPTSLRQVYPADALSPFDNDYTEQLVSDALITGVESLARESAALVVSDSQLLDKVVPCTAKQPRDEPCLRAFISQFGRRAFRRPLAAAEVDRWIDMQDAAMALVEADTFEERIETLLIGFLQHPEFLYRYARGQEVPNKPGIFQLNNWELVSKMSYFLWRSTPSEGVLDAAQAADAAGTILSGAGLKSLASTMLSDERAAETADHFHAMWLGFSELPHDAKTTEAMRQESASLIRRVVFEEDAPWSDILLASETFVSAELATLYGLPSPALVPPGSAMATAAAKACSPTGRFYL